MVFAYQSLQDFTKQAVKGLKYGEDFFTANYTYSNERQEDEALLESFFEHLLTEEEQKKPYMKWLEKKKVLDELKSQMSMPGFLEKLRMLTKNEFYKRLVFHVPASDMMDQLKIEIGTKIYYYKFIQSMGMVRTSPESGNIMYFALNQDNIGIVHTIFN